MISLLIGKPIILGNELTVLCGGVGYSVAVTSQTLASCSSQNEVTLYIYTHVKEDAIELYGFHEQQEKFAFQQLLEVSGVGPKTALKIASTPYAHILSAVEQGDVSFFTSFPRVGKKLAQKIIIELKSKIKTGADLNLAEPSGEMRELWDALLALGYQEQEIQRVVQSIEVEGKSIQDALKESIKLLSKRTYA